MKSPVYLHILLSLGVFVLAPCPVMAEWPSDPAMNLPIADRLGEQTAPLICATPDGGCYVSWFDDADGGYDVYLQRLDPQGNDLWPHNGILVADRSFGYTHHYGLDVDAEGNALLAFRDDRFGGEQATAAMVSPDGELVWGANGVQLNGPTVITESPMIAATSDGHVVVGWTINHGDCNDVWLQRLDATGTPQWPSDVVLTPAAGSYRLVDIHASDNGSVIVLLVKEGPAYWDPRHLHVQKISSTGTQLWGTTPLVLFDNGTLTMGYFPKFVPDGSGGAVFGWNRIDPSGDAYAQHILADGTELFGHNGSLASTTVLRSHLEPSVSYCPDTGDTFLLWIEYFVEEFISYYAVYAQRFDAAGTRQWGDEGLALTPLTETEVLQVRNVRLADDAIFFWDETVAVNTQHLRAARLNNEGTFVWEPSPIITFSSANSRKEHLDVTPGAQPEALLVWMDNRNDFSDIYGQNVWEDGTLGIASGGCGDEEAGDCCEPNFTPACSDLECCEAVCSYMPYCCGEEGWDDFCAQAAWEDPNCNCGGGGGCGDPMAGDCCEANGTPYCADLECCEAVCAYMPYCCGEEGWDDFCAQAAWEDPNCNCGSQIGACCNPITGICTDDTGSGDCLPPLQFTAGATCESLDPPCGNPGACCDDNGEGFCEEGVFEALCEGTRFLGGGTCEDFEPPCGAIEPIEILFLDPPTDPPPDIQCGCEMTPFPADPRPEYEMVDSVPSPCPFGGDIQFSIPMWHLHVPESWLTWSHGYTGDVYHTSAYSNEVTLTLPPGTCGFYFYVQPGEWELFDFQVTVNGITTSEPFSVNGQGGATYVGVCAPNIETIHIVNLGGDTLAVGEFGICCTCDPIFGACCDPENGVCTDEVAASDCQPPLEFSYNTPCEALDPPCGNPGACCDPFTGDCQDGVTELGCPEDYRFEAGLTCEQLDPPCGTPGCCCLDAEGTSSVEFEALCLSQGGRFIPGLGPDECVAEAFEPPCGMWECSGILYAPTKDDSPAWRYQVSQLCGCPVDYWDARWSTPTLEVLREYCMVFTWVDYPYADKVAMGDVLAAYVDTAGKVVLGQWTYPTSQGNWLAGEIMTPAYCPITAESYSHGTYAGDGTDCAWCRVTSLENQFVDRCTLVAGAESNGTLTGGEPALAWRADRSVYYSPGNTGPAYMPGDTAQLVGNIYACEDASSSGACCDPYSGICTDEVTCDACPVGDHFFVNQTCEELDPPCGNPGCCCEDDTGSASIKFEADCSGRFLSDWPGEECVPESFDPVCGEYEPCIHRILMRDDYGDGWTNGFIDVYVNGHPVLTNVTLEDGYGPETVAFEAATGDEITTMWTSGGYAYEASYCIYDALAYELGCDGLIGLAPEGLTVVAGCEEPVCGDGICAEAEDCCTCPQDCGDYQCPEQPPDRFNGVPSDLDCNECETLMQIVAENFMVCEGDMREISAVRFWGGYRPDNDSTDPDAFSVVFYVDGGHETPGVDIATYGPMPATTKTATGATVVGVDEYEYTIDLEPNLMLEGGLYWVAVYNNTTETNDSWFWETSAADECAGLYSAVRSPVLPDEWFSLFPADDLALELICRQDGDLDGDGDMDLDDFAIFAGCMAGPDVDIPPEGCDPMQFVGADFQQDGDVDCVDFTSFQDLFADGVEAP